VAEKKKPKKPPIEKKSVLARLERARDEQLSISVRRWIPRADRLDGFVVAIGEKWVALSKLDGVRLDGWSLLRLKDIQAVGIDPDPDCFEVRALKVRGQWPPTAPELKLDDVVGVIASASAAAPMTSVFVEFDRPDICWVGSVTAMDADNLKLLEVSTQAEWYRKPRSIDPEDVTRIEFGGSYEEALDLVAGPPPTD
jgi:hypothetical protein